MYRERFEVIIKTEGEDSSGGGGGYSQRPLSSYRSPAPSHQVLAAGAPGVVDEKQQMWKNEKAVNGMA